MRLSTPGATVSADGYASFISSAGRQSAKALPSYAHSPVASLIRGGGKIEPAAAAAAAAMRHPGYQQFDLILTQYSRAQDADPGADSHEPGSSSLRQQFQLQRQRAAVEASSS